jgi:spore germination protein YaaH
MDGALEDTEGVGGAAADYEEEEFDELLPPEGNLPVSGFGEIWAYLVAGKEASLRSTYPISDLVYFGAEVDSYGRLSDVPKRKNIAASYKGRVHLCIACNSGGLTHFVLLKGSEARAHFIDSLVEAAADYDGLNIDLELVPARDGEAFLSFLAELRARLGAKMLTAALPARTAPGGVYDYRAAAEHLDRIFVMAYDEHWSGSKAGPVASMAWCKKVAAYALGVLGSGKLIMGMPFYGRAWGNTATARALVSDTTEKLKDEFGVKEISRENGIPYFSYETQVKVTVYYEDPYSVAARAAMYDKQGVSKIGFWSLGQESRAVWQTLRLVGDFVGD